MFENEIEIKILEAQNPIDLIKSNFSWQDRDILVQEINEYIKTKKIIQSILLDSLNYRILWKDKECFEKFIVDKRYTITHQKLNNCGIYLIWK